MEFMEIDTSLREAVGSFVEKYWKSRELVSLGRVHKADELPGYVALKNGKVQGVITYVLEDGDCEIISLDSRKENVGVGSGLLKRVVHDNKARGLGRIWLVTTNDNVKAMRFYQRRGFEMKAVHQNSIEKARSLKPQIPLLGYEGIPILHEVEFEIKLK